MSRIHARPVCRYTLLVLGFGALIFGLGRFAEVSKAASGRSDPALVFLPTGGVYTNELKVKMTAKEPGDTIRFTLDGSEPDTNSPPYSAPISITNSTLVRARRFRPDARSSAMVSEAYTVLGKNLWDFRSTLPLVIINTFGKTLSQEAKIPVSVRLIRPEGQGSSLTGPADFDGRATLNIRGHSSRQFPKHSYTLKLQDEAGDSRKATLLGLPPDSDWVLYAPYPDKTLIRDVLAYELSNRMGHYAPRTRFVEVFTARSAGALGQKHYAGVYVLVEKIKRSKDRVNISELRPEDNSEPTISGGYIFKKDHREKAEPGFATSRGFDFFYVEPKAEAMTSLQKEWLTGYLNSFEKALHGRNFKDPLLGYAAFIDVDSFIDYHWMVEFSKNIDGYRLSNYLHKDRGGKLKMDPIWDWNLSFGNANYLEGWEEEGWYWPQVSRPDYPWFKRLFQDPDFQQRYADRWSQLRTNVFAVSNLLARTDSLAASLESAQVRNFRRWRILGEQVWPNWYVGKTYEDELRWLKAWMQNRHRWIDSQFIEAPQVSLQHQPRRAATMRAPAGAIYYTLNGGDPRAPGGAAAPEAKLYDAPISVPANTRVTARVLWQNKWSGPAVVE